MVYHDSNLVINEINIDMLIHVNNFTQKAIFFIQWLLESKHKQWVIHYNVAEDLNLL